VAVKRRAWLFSPADAPIVWRRGVGPPSDPPHIFPPRTYPGLGRPNRVEQGGRIRPKQFQFTASIAARVPRPGPAGRDPAGSTRSPFSDPGPLARNPYATDRPPDLRTTVFGEVLRLPSAVPPDSFVRSRWSLAASFGRVILNPDDLRRPENAACPAPLPMANPRSGPGPDREPRTSPS